MRNGRGWLVALCLLGCSPVCRVIVARAQLLDALFPEGVPGYGTEQGVTVQSRARPEYEPLGIHLGTLTIRPLLGLAAGYDDNIFGGPTRRGAWEIAAQPSVLAGTESSAGSVGLYLSADDVHYLNEPTQNRTDGSAFFGGTFNLGRDKLTLGAGYLSRHEDRTALDALPSDRPVAFTVANARASYDAAFGRFTATPSIELNQWRFDNTTIFGVPVSEASRDRITVQTGVTLRYGWMSGRDVLWVNRVVDTRYDEPAAGVASNNSTAWQSLVGVDYDDDAVWRYKLLGGLEYRQAAAGAASQTTGIAEAEVIWSPTGMTTLRASAFRGIEDAAQTGLSSYTYSTGQLRVDHELQRNVLLTASATVRQATFNQTGGQQLGVGFDTGATWLINRTLRLSLTYDFADGDRDASGHGVCRFRRSGCCRRGRRAAGRFHLRLCRHPERRPSGADVPRCGAGRNLPQCLVTPVGLARGGGNGTGLRHADPAGCDGQRSDCVVTFSIHPAGGADHHHRATAVLAAGAGGALRPGAAVPLRPANGLRHRPGRVPGHCRVYSRAPGATGVPGGRLAETGASGGGRGGERPGGGHRSLHRRQPAVPGRCRAAGTRVDAAGRPGMGIPAGARSSAARRPLPAGQPSHRPAVAAGKARDGYFGPIRPDAGCPGTLNRLPVSVRVVPLTLRIEKSLSRKFPT